MTTYLNTLLTEKQNYVSKREREYPIHLSQLDSEFVPTCLYQLMQVHKQCRKSGLIGEIIRASPDDGLIQIGDIRRQVGHYIVGGVIAVSVNTETNWFGGDKQHLEKAREVIDSQGKPVVLIQRDFIFTRYQILESLQAKSDTFTLFIPLLKLIWPDIHQLIERVKSLLVFARNHSIEPIIEISSETDLAIAKQVGAKIIQIGTLDNYTVEYLAGQVPIDIEVIVPGRNTYRLHSLRSDSYFCTVGKDLMLSVNPSRQIFVYRNHLPNLKICGIDNLQTAIKLHHLSEIMMMGFVFSKETHQSNCRFVKKVRRYFGPKQQLELDTFTKHLDPQETTIYYLQEVRRIQSFPLLVGVFTSESSETIKQTADLCQLDLVQLEGDIDYQASIKKLGFPIIRVMDLSNNELTSRLMNDLVLQYQSEGDIVLFKNNIDLQSDSQATEFPYQKLNYAKTYIYPGVDITPQQSNITDIVDNVHPWLINISVSQTAQNGTSTHVPNQNTKFVQRMLKVLSTTKLG